MRCAICKAQLSMRHDTADRRYFDQDARGWAHKACDPAAPKTNEERYLDAIFGPRTYGRQREAAATEDMAAVAGHHVNKQYQNYINLGTTNLNGTHSRMTRLVCSCGWESEWFKQSKAAVEARREHLKDAAIYG